MPEAQFVVDTALAHSTLLCEDANQLNLKGSRRMLQVGIGVSTQYDDTVMMNVESHQLALRSIVLGVLSGYGEEDVAGIDGRSKVAVHLRDAINAKLEELENFGGIEEVHFTSFVMQ